LSILYELQGSLVQDFGKRGGSGGIGKKRGKREETEKVKGRSRPVGLLGLNVSSEQGVNEKCDGGFVGGNLSGKKKRMRVWFGEGGLGRKGGLWGQL